MEVALIVAGGSGTRMRSDYPKQFLELAGQPILMHTIEAFYHYSDSTKIIVVLPESRIDQWHQIKNQFHFQISHDVVAGGTTRTQSVRNGLALVNDNDTVAIHDGVRPLVSVDIISNAFQTAAKLGNAVVAVKLKESLRELDSEGNSQAVNRSNFCLIQTPQAFRGETIKNAYRNVESSKEEFTDDAGVLESCGYSINLVDGDYENIKITSPEDIILAESILKIRSNQTKPI